MVVLDGFCICGKLKNLLADLLVCHSGLIVNDFLDQGNRPCEQVYESFATFSDDALFCSVLY